MASAIAAVGAFPLPVRPATLHLLACAIIGQSISLSAAERIAGRFSEAFGDGASLSSRRLAVADESELRGLGLTAGKARALRGAARLWEHEGWPHDGPVRVPDGEVAGRLTSVPGIGPWTAGMFLIFGLRRADVLPTGDLGLRVAVQMLYGLGERPDPASLERIAEPWRPWRTVGTVYAWQWLMKRRGQTLSGEYGWWR